MASRFDARAALAMLDSSFGTSEDDDAEITDEDEPVAMLPCDKDSCTPPPRI